MQGPGSFSYFQTLSDRTSYSEISIMKHYKNDRYKKVSFFFNNFMIDNFEMFQNFQEFEHFPENSKLRSILVLSASASN